MSISLVKAAAANFRVDEDSETLNKKFMDRLGTNKRYLPARLAISRSLAIPELPETLEKNHNPGKAIKGDTLFGSGESLSVWLSLIIESSEETDIDIKRIIALVGAHWRRGLTLLDTEWRSADEDMPQFVKRLANIAGLSSNSGEGGGGSETLCIDVPIGEISTNVATKNKEVWSLNAHGGSPHGAIMGGVGTGKTRMAVSMLQAIRKQASVPLLAFDFKGDLGTDSEDSGYQIDKTFDATTLEPPRTPIPLNVLSLTSRGSIDLSEAASRFRESFSHLKGARLGDQQRPLVLEAAKLALAREDPCELSHIKTELEELYDAQDLKPDGAISTMSELCEFPLFEPTHDPATFFKQSWIIKLPSNVNEDSKTIVVNLVLAALDYYLNGLNDAAINPDNSRGLRLICLIDEAHRVLGTKLPSLSNLVRMSRSKGGSIFLISQSPDDFSGVEDEFLSEMGLVASFRTNAPPRHASRILGKKANLSSLGTGECYIKRRVDKSSIKIKAW